MARQKVTTPLEHSIKVVCTEKGKALNNMALDLGGSSGEVVDMADFLTTARLVGGELSTETDSTDSVTLIAGDANSVIVANRGNISVASGAGAGAAIMDASGATINPLAPGVANVVLGATATTMKFINMSAITLTAGPAAATIVADGGSNTFIAGNGALTVTGGAGADNYVYHMGSALMTIKDFSVAKGDILTIDKALLGWISQTPDNRGGTMLSFGSAGAGIDVEGVVAVPLTSIRWV